MRRLALLTAAAGLTLMAAPALAVHQSHHGPFAGPTSQDKRIVMRVAEHDRIGIRVGWRAACEYGSVARITRFRNVRVDENGRFFARNGNGVGVRGKIGFDPQGDPVVPEPFSFANNEARGRLRARVSAPGKGQCRSGLVTWEARR